MIFTFRYDDRLEELVSCERIALTDLEKIDIGNIFFIVIPSAIKISMIAQDISWIESNSNNNPSIHNDAFLYKVAFSVRRFCHQQGPCKEAVLDKFQVSSLQSS